MTNVEARVHLMSGDTIPVVSYLYNTLRTKAPVNNAVQQKDWYQEISIIVILKRLDALNMDNSLGFLYTCVSNKMSDYGRAQQTERRVTAELTHLMQGFDSYVNTKGFDEACWEKVLRLTQSQISEKPEEKQDFYHTLVRLIIYDDQGARTKLLSMASTSRLSRGKQVVRGMLKKSIETVLIQEGLWY